MKGSGKNKERNTRINPLKTGKDACLAVRSKWNALSLMAKVFIIIALACAVTIPAALAASNSYTYSADPTKHKWVQTDDTHWTMDINNDGKTDVTLTASKDDSGNDVWKYTFNVEDNDQAYYVYEQMLNNGSTLTTPWMSGYTSAGTDSKLGIEAEPGEIDPDTHSYTITNNKEHSAKEEEKTGSLRISKAVTGTMPNEDQTFAFTVTLSSDTKSVKDKLSGLKMFGDVAFNDGVARVSLKNGESKEITDIPEGTKYTVTEADQDNYKLDTDKTTGDSGTISSTEKKEASFTNESTYTPPKETGTGAFTVRKTVDGSGAPDDAEYNFVVALTGLVPDNSYQGAKSDGSTVDFTADSSGNANVTLKLKKDESCKFTIPENAKYRVVEEAGKYTSSYRITDNKDSAEIASSRAQNSDENTELATKKETADKDEDVTVTFNNTYKTTQKLTVRKFMSKSENGSMVRYKENTKFEFTIAFYNLEENAVINSSIGKITPDEDGEASKTFNLPATGEDGEAVFENVPEDAQYVITETKNSSIPSYKITTENEEGKEITGTVSKNEASGTPGTDLSTERETLEAGQSDVVTFTNAANKDLVIKKKVKGNLGDIFKKFAFTVKLSGLSANGSYKYEGEGIDFDDGNNVNTEEKTITADASGNAEFTVRMKSGKEIKLKALPAGSTYIIDELKSDHIASCKLEGDGDSPVIVTAEDENIGKGNLSTSLETVDSGDGTVTVTYTNKRSLATVTGAPAFIDPLVEILVILAAVLAAGYIFRKKRAEIV